MVPSTEMDLINSYAIVAYVAGPIARFADRLRGDLVPGTGHHAHITVLPPRPLTCDPAEAAEFARQRLSPFEPFEVSGGDVEVFSSTQVIYLSLTSGKCELTQMHDVLNTEFLHHDEEFKYIPHITLGQKLIDNSFDRCLTMARKRWEEFGAHPPLRIETLTVVQQRIDGNWKDLAELELGRVAAVG